jgi:polysaccharide export outer membrane protein
VAAVIGVGLHAHVIEAAQARPAERASAAASPDYRIGAGDVLQLFVWKETELTRDVTVRVDGKITIPLLGDVQAAGRTPEQLATEIANGLKRFLAAPQVTISVREAASSKFYVIGKVSKAGAFPIGGRTTLLQALALAGGLQEFAKADRILIVHEGTSDDFAIVNYKKLETGAELAQNNPFLRPGDTIVVP